MCNLKQSVVSLAAVLALAFVSPAALAAPRSATAWSVVAASGQVEVLPAALESLGWQPMARGTVVQADSQIRTGADGRATLTAKGHFIVVDPDTRLDLPAPTAPGQPTRVFQSAGSATYQVERARKERFQVITPYLVAGVKGTRFRVSVSDAGAAVEVAAGIVEVSSLALGDSREVFAGEAVHIDAGSDAVLRPGVGEVVSELELAELKADDPSLDGDGLLKEDSLLEDDADLGLEELDADLLETEDLERTLEDETEVLIKESEDTLRDLLSPSLSD